MLSSKEIVSLISISTPPPLILWRSYRTATHPVVLCELVLLVSLVLRIAAILALLLLRKVCSSVISSLIPFAFHLIRCRLLVDVGVESDPGFT